MNETVGILIFAAIVIGGLFLILRKKTSTAQPPVAAGAVQNDGSIRVGPGEFLQSGRAFIPTAELGIAESYGWSKVPNSISPDPSVVLVERA